MAWNWVPDGKCRGIGDNEVWMKVGNDAPIKVTTANPRDVIVIWWGDQRLLTGNIAENTLDALPAVS